MAERVLGARRASARTGEASLSTARTRDEAEAVRHARKLFVNLPVRDLERSMHFFSRLGFRFNARFTDDRAACMIISDAAFVVLLTEPFFQTFRAKASCDTRTHMEGLFALSCRSRAEVAQLLAEAIAAGATPASAPIDHGFIYASSFHDLDGHHWELLWSDPHTAYA
jgi:predicted lactoylglutathione lyase